MKCRVEINRSQFDARAVIVLPDNPANTCLDYVRIGTELHVFTDAELRARDERIAHATRDYIQKYDPGCRYLEPLYDPEVTTIIAAAEADQ